jgi:hypothetical protein
MNPAMLMRAPKFSITIHNIPEVVDEHGHKYTSSEPTDELLAKADYVVFTTNHSCMESGNEAGINR